MPTRWETFPIELTGGLREDLPSVQQGLKMPGSATLLENFEPSLEGGYRRVNGYTKFDEAVVPSSDPNSSLLGIGFLEGKVIVPREGSIYESVGSGWTEVASGRTQTTTHRFTPTNLDGTNRLIGVDGVNYPYSYDGTSVTDITGSPDVLGARHAVEFVDHMFYSKGNLVTFSAPFDETDFTPANGAGNFRMPNDVTGMIVFRKRLFIFTEKEIKVLDGTSSSSFELTSVSERVGCIKEDTIQEVAADVIFLAADGLRLLGATDKIGDFRNETATKNIQSLFTSFSNSYSQFASTIIREKSQYRIFGYRSGVSLSDSEGFLGTQFEPSNPNSFQWASTKGFQVRHILSEVYQGNELVYFTNDSQFVYRLESGDDLDGTAIEARFNTPFISFNDPRMRKTVYTVQTYLTGEGAVSGQVRLVLDQASISKVQPSPLPFASGNTIEWDAFSWGSGLWSSDTTDDSVISVVAGAGKNVSLRYSFSDGDTARWDEFLWGEGSWLPQPNTFTSPFTIDTIFVEYSPEDRK